MADYSEDIASAYESIAEAGTAIRVYTTSRAPGTRPWGGGAVSESFVGSVGVFLPASVSGSSRGFGFRPDTLIPEATEVVYIPGSVGTLEGYEYIERLSDNKIFHILSFDILAPDGTPILYMVQAKT